MTRLFSPTVYAMLGLWLVCTPLCIAQISAQQNPGASEDSATNRIAATAAAVDTIYRDSMSSNQTTGLVYGVVLNGKLVYGNGLGYADSDHQHPVDSHSLFRIASMSKNFTAIAILQLRDSGKLRLDDPVADYLPEMANLPLPTRDSPVLSIRHLLTHGGGLPEDNPWGDRQLAMPAAEFSRLLGSSLSFSTTPDTRYEYSNLGFAMLGRIVEKVSGLGFDEYTKKYILSPLGMTHSVWEFAEADPDRLVAGFNVNAGLETPEHHGAFSPMAGLITSLEDFAKFASLHISAWPPRDDADTGILKRSSLREMHQPMRITRFVGTGSCPFMTSYSYGLTWAQECDTLPYLSHNGGLPGFTSNWLFFPELGLAVIAFGNRSYAPLTATNRAVAKLIVKQANLKPAPVLATPVLEQRKQQLLGFLFDWTQAGGSDIFATNFFRDLNIAQRNVEAGKLRQTLGNILETGTMQADNRLRGHFLIKGEKRNANVFFSLTPEQVPRIQAVETTLLEP